MATRSRKPCTGIPSYWHFSDFHFCAHSVSHGHLMYRHRVHAWIKCLQCACQISLFHPLHSHASAVLAVPARSPRHLVLVCTFLAELFPIRKRGSSALPHERRGVDYLADSTHSASYEPKEFDKITAAGGDTTPINDPNYDNIFDFSKITRKNTGLCGVSTSLESSVSYIFHGESKKGRFSMSKKSRRNNNRSHFLQTHREFYHDERDLREDLERRAQQAVLGKKIKFRENKRLSTTCRVRT